MLTLRNLSLRRGSQLLFEDVSLTIHASQKVGLTGANGTGKSSLFALLQDEIHSDRGDLEFPRAWTIAHVAQETPGLLMPAIEHVLDGDEELRRIEAALITAQDLAAGTQIAELHAQFDAIDGYSARSRAARLMTGLGFREQQLQQPVAELSGGWRVRLNLARALMCRSDLLLLDEPTNHLDLDAVLWLEQWLRHYPGTLLLISHDRDFLDGIVDHVIHIERKQLKLYRGNYTAFEEQRSAQLAQQQASYEKQQREVAHLQRFVDRFRAKATKAKQAQSRIKALERMEIIAPAHVDSPFQFSFRQPERLPNPLILLDAVDVGYGNEPIIKNTRLSLHPGSRFGLLGPNGAGKSTLIKLLAGHLPASSGERIEGQGMTIGYFAQHQLEQLRPEWSPLQHLQRSDPLASDQELRNFLGGFDFNGDKALAPVAPFSGGEKARLALALLVWQRPNVLLLDEPTNHLDLQMRLALNLALQEYSGALVVVSHDRHLLRTTTDAFILVHGQQAQPFTGDLDDYRAWLSDHQRSPKPEPTTDSKTTQATNISRREQKRLDAERRNQLAVKRRPLEKQIKSLEQQMDKLQTNKAEIDELLAQPDIYDDQNKAQLKERLKEQGEIARELERVEEQWMELQEQLEAIE